MYIIVEYVAYLVGVAILAGVLFLGSVLFLVAKDGARRATDASLTVASQAVILAVASFRLLRAKQPLRAALYHLRPIQTLQAPTTAEQNPQA